MSCLFAFSGYPKCLEITLLWNCWGVYWFGCSCFERGRRREVALVFKEKSRDSLDMPHVNKNCCSNVTCDLT